MVSLRQEHTNGTVGIKPKVMNTDKKLLLFVMGVSGSGKSTIGQLLAKRLGIEFFDADDYHTKENVRKMVEGNPLSDLDRQVWLERLNLLAKKHEGVGAVIACSALKNKYRAMLQKDIVNSLRFVYLRGSFEEVSLRLEKRKGHFMPPGLLRSQFEALEVPKEAITVPITGAPEEILCTIIKKLRT